MALIAGGTGLILVVFASGYGYHRDELYFIAAGQHLDWAYADQGPVIALIARAMTELAPESLTVLRLPSALAAALTVLITGLLTRELGGGKRAAAIAAACCATGVLFLFTGHILSTTTFDLLVWTALTWIVVRAVRTGDRRLWLVGGLVLGVGLLNKPLPAFLAVGLLVGVAIAGPRRLLTMPAVWVAAAVAALLWLPWVVWQADHGWPQIDVAREISTGGSGSSEPRWAIIPFQVLLVGPLLAPVWIAGLVRLFRDSALRDLRFFAWTWVALVVIFTVSGGKPYYLAGLLPLLIAAGSADVDRWLDRGRSGARRAALGTALVLSACVTAVIALPILPADDADAVVAANSDVGETIGWRELADPVTAIEHQVPGSDRTVIFTANYGEAGALERFDERRARVYSGHNGYADWGPPPDGSAPVITVGLSPAYAGLHFRDCVLKARVDNGRDIDNDEQGAPVMLCDGPRRPWSTVWPDLRHLD